MQYTTRKALTPKEKEEQARKRAEREALIRARNNRLGITIFQGSWIMVFVALIVVNWQMRFSPEWMAEGAVRPDGLLPTVATAALIVSAVLQHRALAAVKSDRVSAFMQQWLMAIGLGVIFFVIMLSQFFALTPGDGQYASVYRLMIGYHALHAVVIGAMMVQVYRYGQRGRYHAANNWSVEATMRLWDFVVVAWVLFYVVLYII
jgi:heme/copper-type cytochrome/quinol oxidase subunit 3